MSSTEQDTIDESPFFRFDPFIVLVVVGVVEKRIEGLD